jgi:hypothetical protein
MSLCIQHRTHTLGAQVIKTLCNLQERRHSRRFILYRSKLQTRLVVLLYPILYSADAQVSILKLQRYPTSAKHTRYASMSCTLVTSPFRRSSCKSLMVAVRKSMRDCAILEVVQ